MLFRSPGVNEVYGSLALDSQRREFGAQQGYSPDGRSTLPGHQHASSVLTEVNKG